MPRKITHHPRPEDTSGRFLPVSKLGLEKRGWDSLDIILVTGDAYVDHPSYAASLLGRLLEDAGYRVGIISQPRCSTTDDFKKLGRPNLFFGVTAGNLDSMVANYSASKKPRSSDDYSPGGKPGLRPDRASIIYTNKIKEAFPGVPVVLGGVEASLRRLAHYDYWSDKVRRSYLVDSKADILVYGMGERQILEIASRAKAGESIREMSGIRGTVVARSSLDGIGECMVIPAFEEVSSDKDKFNASFRAVYREADPIKGKTVVQKHAERFVVQFPPAYPLSEQELDRLYLFNYTLGWHPDYDKDGGIPGFETVRNSIISHRGCSGGCNFCTLYLHQGRIVQSRSSSSIVEEIKRLSQRNDFRGTVTDIGGPTANMYKAECASWKTSGACRDKSCLVPAKCKNLKLGYREALGLWDRVKKIPGVKHVFVGSGVRHDLLVGDDSDEYLKALCRDHVSGQLKVAPEHLCPPVLDLMNKPSFKVYEHFVDRFNAVNKALNKKQYLVNYLLSAHPGSDLSSALELALYLSKRHINPEQIQDYIPLPMTVSACMYFTGKDPFTGKKIYVAKSPRERKLQRSLIQSRQPKNRKYVLEALKKLGKLYLAKELLN
ncbi:MAG: YgiQ family radical SAM protein [Candidatus Omnitrophota bacterium]|jgi:uncharacterized radical SAM protein YgiQ